MLPTLLRSAAQAVRVSALSKPGKNDAKICIHEDSLTVQRASLTKKDKLKNGTPFIDVYTDASVREYGSPAGCTRVGVGLGIHWPQSWHGIKDASMHIFDGRLTSDAAELRAVIEALRLCHLKRGFQLRIYTDSTVCSQMHRLLDGKMKRKKFKEKFADLIEQYTTEVGKFEHRPLLEWVKGHGGVPGNVVADKLARQATTPTGFRWDVLDYGVAAFT